MTPGVVYTAPDGSTVELQLFIHEREPWTDGIATHRAPDRVKDARLLMTATDGKCAALHLHSSHEFADTVLTMYGNIRPPLHAKGGVVTRPEEWSGPLAKEQP